MGPSILGLVAALVMVFGQSLAVGAVQNSTGVWIEICGGDGTKLVQTEGGSPAGDCTHCDFCAVQFSAASLGPPTPPLNSLLLVFAPVQFCAVSTDTVPGAEQYWAANRGPPLASEVNMNTISASRAAMTTSVYGGATWL